MVKTHPDPPEHEVFFEDPDETEYVKSTLMSIFRIDPAVKDHCALTPLPPDGLLFTIPGNFLLPICQVYTAITIQTKRRCCQNRRCRSLKSPCLELNVIRQYLPGKHQGVIPIFVVLRDEHQGGTTVLVRQDSILVFLHTGKKDIRVQGRKSTIRDGKGEETTDQANEDRPASLAPSPPLPLRIGKIMAPVLWREYHYLSILPNTEMSHYRKKIECPSVSVIVPKTFCFGKEGKWRKCGLNNLSLC
jgi:hypothetical protein